MRIPILAAALAAALCLFATQTVQACGVDHVKIGELNSEIDTWSDGSGKVLRLRGTVETGCASPTGVRLLISARDARGAVIRQQQEWIDDLPPGGGTFELVGKMPYDPVATSYEAEAVRTR